MRLFKYNLRQYYIYCLKDNKHIMKTRAQKKREEQEEKSVLHGGKGKKTKKQLLQEKNKKIDDDTLGKASGRKKVKQQQKPISKTRRGKKEPVRVQDDTKIQPKKQIPSKKSDFKSNSKENRNSTKVQNEDLQAKPRKIPDKNQKQTKEQAKKQQAKIAAKPDSNDKKQHVKTIQFKGKVPIDQHCTCKNSNHHILEHDGKIYSATLNQTSVTNNNNKFYIIQVVQSDSDPNKCYFYTRWGRVGVVGQTSNMGPYPMNVAIRQFNQKYHAKHNKGDYRELELNYEDEQKKDDDNTNVNKDNQKKESDFEKSKLPSPVKNLIDLIFDLKMMKQQMIQIGYNAKRMPLGKLSKENILKGYKILQQLLQVITGKINKQKITQLSSDFYSIIPHDFGFQKMSNFNLDSEQKVKQKIEMIESLAQIRIATALINNSTGIDNQLDSNYKKLKRDIHPVGKDTNQYDIIHRYLQSTHADTHTSYSLELVDLFALTSQEENVRYTNHIHNKTLLWHGSRLTNFVGILSQGLRIAPPQAPVTGYMFGKGVYFADMSSKSANYCFTSRQNSTGILLLCEVALGEMNQKMHADFYASNLPSGKDSTKGMGRTAPDPLKVQKLENGVIVPMGPGVPTNLGCSLLYNEFIVYDIAQIKVRYLLRTKFNYRMH